jgi:hypothetical protein
MHSRSPAGPLLMEHDGVLCGHLKSVMAVDMYEALSMQQAFVPTADLYNNHRRQVLFTVPRDRGHYKMESM